MLRSDARIEKRGRRKESRPLFSGEARNGREKSRVPFFEKYLWKPTPAVVDYSNIARFMKRHAIADYRALIARSSGEIEWFWNAVVEELGIEFYRPYQTTSGHE